MSQPAQGTTRKDEARTWQAAIYILYIYIKITKRLHTVALNKALFRCTRVLVIMTITLRLCLFTVQRILLMVFSDRQGRGKVSPYQKSACELQKNPVIHKLRRRNMHNSLHCH